MLLSPVTSNAPRPLAAAAPPPPPSTAPVDRTTLSVGPVPDYAPLAGVVVHQLLFDICPPLVQGLRQLIAPEQLVQTNIGFNGPRSGYSDLNVVWVRDFHPAFVRHDDGSTHVVKFLSDLPAGSNWDDSQYIPVQPPAPDMRFYPAYKQWLHSEKCPVLLEPGNMVATGEYAILTDRVLRQNAQPHRELQQEGYQARPPEDVLNTLAKGLDLDREHIVVLPQMPSEATGHVDMYVMALGPREVMLPQIPDECFNVVTYDHEQATGRTVQHFLDEQAKALEARGFHVDRLPMMPPTFLNAAPTDPTGWHGHFDSPANALLLNIGNQKRVLLPTVSLNGFSPEYQAMSGKFQQQWATFFADRDWEPHLLDATAASRANGLFRCLSYPMPELAGGTL